MLNFLQCFGANVPVKNRHTGSLHVYPKLIKKKEKCESESKKYNKKY